MNRQARHGVRARLRAIDVAAFEQVASRHWPAAEEVLPRLSRSANHGALWFGVAAGMWALGGVRSRRAAVRGAASLLLASAAVNTVGKQSVRRARPVLEGVPVVRRLPRQPFTTSFPSGHTASAAAFAFGAALESRRWGAVLAPLAVSVAFSRVYTGVHYPSDVAAGAALGAGAALAVRGAVPSRAQLPPPARPRADAPALPAGDGLVVVVNHGSGAQPQMTDPLRQLRAELPKAQVVVHEPGDGRPLPEVLDAAAREAADRGGALGVYGGDGTVNAAVSPALRHHIPLAVFPGGTFNHFAADLGTEDFAETCAAVAAGSAVRADVGRVRPLRHTGPGLLTSGEPVYFLNTFSLGVYPELVRLREHWSPRIGGPLATLLAVRKVLRGARPLRAEINGRRRSLWLLFVGNGTYRSIALAPVRRYDLADGLLDVRVAHAGRAGRARLLATALAGGLAHTRLYGAAKARRLLICGLPAGTYMAYDGEAVPAQASIQVDKLEEALTVYRRTG